MRADNSRFLLNAAARRRADTAQRAAAAVRRLDTAGQPVTFAAVADAAGVSRSWLYRDQATRAEIERLRHAQPTSAPAAPSRQRGSADSWRQRHESLLRTNQQLAEDNQRLREQVATLLGERRAARTHGRRQN
jgi:hypothetical protein